VKLVVVDMAVHQVDGRARRSTRVNRRVIILVYMTTCELAGQNETSNSDVEQPMIGSGLYL